MVYGDCIEAYSCLAALLQSGLPPRLLAFIEPFPSRDPLAMRVNCFNNETVDKRVQKSIEDLGITAYRRCTLVGWTISGSLISAVKLLSPKKELVLPCFALFYYGVNGMDLRTFKGT
ncbi:Cilia- and flagella-associated protein 61 [Eumeta japonica]|uniref:Cilia-and flagella-associated protein 61 n=1 Tax=Eumeta variegata TaxID=151549 RepID=A0A4C1ZSX9_EUMVA|nr:Cilia- and flagella-associated protein 61 [Eumeta japonica]